MVTKQFLEGIVSAEKSDKLTECRLALDKAKAIMDLYYNDNGLNEPELNEYYMAHIRSKHHDNQALFSAALDYIHECGEALDWLIDITEREHERSQA
jgi:hypothetical protein